MAHTMLLTCSQPNRILTPSPARRFNNILSNSKPASVSRAAFLPRTYGRYPCCATRSSCLGGIRCQDPNTAPLYGLANDDVNEPAARPIQEENKEEKTRFNEMKKIVKWNIVKKVYGILAAQAVIVAAFYAVGKIFPPVSLYLMENPAVMIFQAATAVTALIQLWYMIHFGKKKKIPFKRVIFRMISVVFNVRFGLHLAPMNGMLMVKAVISTLVMTSTLIRIGFWISPRKQSFLHPILLSSSSIASYLSFYFMIFKANWISAATIRKIDLVSYCFSVMFMADDISECSESDFDDYIIASCLYLLIVWMFQALVDIFIM